MLRISLVRASTKRGEGQRVDGLVEAVRGLGPSVAAGAVGAVLVVLSALAPGSPVIHHTQRGWFLGVPWPPLSSNLTVLVSAALACAGVILLARGWLGAMRRASQVEESCGERRASAAIAAVMVLWAIPLVLGPPLLTRDPYSYAAQGELYSQGFDPYLHTPAVLGHGDFYREIDPLWRTSKAPYGPLFMLIARTATQLGGHRLIVAVVLLKIVSLFGVGLMAYGIRRLARASGHSPTTAVAFVVLNPITLLHLVAGAHNESIMIGLLVLGLALALERRPLLGIAVCVLAGAVKLPAMAGVAFIAWHWASDGAGRERLRRLGLAALSAALALGLLELVARTSFGWVTLITTPTKVQSYLSPVTTSGIGIGLALSLVGVSRDAFLTVWQLAFIALALGISARALVRVKEDGLARATGIALLAVAALSPAFFPFYLLWGLAPLAAAGWRDGRRPAVWACIGLSFVMLPGGRDLLDAVVALGPWWAGGLATGLAILSLPARASRLRLA